jgi:hypothetical protein
MPGEEVRILRTLRAGTQRVSPGPCEGFVLIDLQINSLHGVADGQPQEKAVIIKP